jgi:hypothetical protein
MAPICTPYLLGWPKAVLWVLVALAVFTMVATAFAVIAWALNPAGQGWRAMVLMVTWVIAVYALWRHMQQETNGQLRFDGERWWFQAMGHKGQEDAVFDEQVVRVSVVAHFEHHLWMRLQWDHLPYGPTNATFFAWAQRANDQDNENWLALRRAVFFDAQAHKPLHSPSVL